MLYAIARKTILDFSGVAPSFVMGKFNLYIRLLTTFKAICVYLSLLILPLGLHMERRIQIASSIFEPQTLGALFVILILSIVMSRFFIYSKRLFFASIWFFIGLLPVSNIVPINSFIAEHRVYLPAIGAYMIMGVVIENIFYRSTKIRKVLGSFVLMVIFIFYGIITVERNKDWKDEISFFKSTLKYCPNNARLHLNFGNTYSEHHQREEAIEEYKKAIALKPNYAEAYSNIGAVYMEMGKNREAKENIEKALSIKPNFPNALYTLGILYEEENRYEEAKAYYLKALKIMPDFINCHMHLGYICLRNNEVDKAISHWTEVLRINPNNKEARRLIDKYATTQRR